MPEGALDTTFGNNGVFYSVMKVSMGEWFVLRSEDGSYYLFSFGISGDIPAPADFDGDGKGDAAVFRPSNAVWYLLQTTNGFIARQFGINTDIPVPSAFVR